MPYLLNDKLVDDAKNAAMQAREERKELQSCALQEQRAKGRLELLAQWEEQHEGYLEGTKNILNGKRFLACNKITGWAISLR